MANWNTVKIHAQDLTPRQKDFQQQNMWKKVATTTNEYGHWYLKDVPRNPSYSLPAMDLSPRPSLVHPVAPFTTRTLIDRGYGGYGSYRLRLPDISGLEVAFGTSDYGTSSIYPSPSGIGRYEYQTFPSGTNSLSLQDITDITIKVSMRDGTVFNFPCEPKPPAVPKLGKLTLVTMNFKKRLRVLEHLLQGRKRERSPSPATPPPSHFRPWPMLADYNGGSYWDYPGHHYDYSVYSYLQ